MASKRLGPDDLIQPLKRLQISSSRNRASSSSEDVAFEDVDLPSDKQQLAEKLSDNDTASDWMLQESLTQSNTRCQLKREEYTIGWICALSIELAAAKQMLDEVHQSLPSNEADSNTYELGRIGGHNVVIACLPVGQMGTNAAASVATQMQLTFNSVRLGLMVGIGGGVPSTADVRLGHVVVSRPFKDHSGVVQYDFSKMTPDKFERTGYLNSPPQVFLKAIASLEADHLRERVGFSHSLSKLAQDPRFARDKTGPDD